MQIAVKLDAGSDANGNPRRGWLVYEVESGAKGTWTDSDLLGWVEEGYEGVRALRNAHPAAHELCVLAVPYSEIRAARKNGSRP